MKKSRHILGKSQRMQFKAFVCVLGMILVGILILCRLFFYIKDSGNEATVPEETYTPTVEQVANVLVLNVEGNVLTVMQDGERVSYEMVSGLVNIPEQSFEKIADIELTDGLVSDILIKDHKINGKVLSAGDEYIEIEGYGKIDLADNYRGYRLFNGPSVCDIKDIAFGYDLADFVLDGDNICAILIAREAVMEYIRVLIKSTDYKGIYHEEVIFSADCDFTVKGGEGEDAYELHYPAGDEVSLKNDNELFEKGRIQIVPDVITGKIELKSVTRSQGNPSYRGHLELTAADDGIIVINELPLEEYLYCVVPSEMPASYPIEALKAQTICARTYAYGHMEQAAYPQYGAHLDDSTSYQVYNNILEQESTNRAVKETYGRLLFTEKGDIAGTYYYSTSCGMGSDSNVWKTEEAPTLTYLKSKSISVNALQTDNAGITAAENDKTEINRLGDMLQDEDIFTEYINSTNEDDYEYDESWYRWTYNVKKIDVGHMCEVLRERALANPKLVLVMDKNYDFVQGKIKDFDRVKDMYVLKRGKGGVCDELIIETNKGTYKIITEHNIRYVLNDGSTKVIRQDGKKIGMPTLLPSAFFSLSVVTDKGNVVGYTLIGGGFGHGVGMSQNGAKAMALSGVGSEEILEFFFEGCRIESMYE